MGNGAGFIPDVAVPFTLAGSDVWSVASAGKGDFICIDGLRTGTTGASDTEVAFGFASGVLAGLVSVSGGSS